MVTFNTIQNNSERYLEYIGKHKRAFDIYEDLYPLKLFEDFVQVHANKDSISACYCNIDKDRLYAARFGLGISGLAIGLATLQEAQVLYNRQQQFQAAISFFRKVESHAQVKLNYQLIQQFFSNHFDFRGVTWIGVGVEARPEIGDSRLKLYVTLENAPEKVETAIALCGDSSILRAFLVNKKLEVGFDLFLNGHSEIELYPTITQDELRRVDIRSRILPLLPPHALPLLEQCSIFQVGISPANESNILYFDNVFNPNSFIDNLGNEMSKKVHAYYRHEPVQVLQVGIPEKEFYARSIEQVKLYYLMK